MKMTRIMFLIFFVTSFIFSCQPTEDELIRYIDPEGDYLSVIIDGEEFNWEQVSAEQQEYNGGFSISASTNDGGYKLIRISFSPRSSDDSKLGLYPVEPEVFVESRTLSANYINGEADWIEYEFTSGKLILEELDTINQRIRGSFNFNVESGQDLTSSLTDGDFDIGYE